MQKIISSLVNQVKALDTAQIAIALAVLILACLITFAVRRRNFPPGPWGWPIVGYLPYLSYEAHLDFIELGKKYGDVFSVSLGTKPVVVLHGVEAIKEALMKPEFLGRPPGGPLKLFLKGSPFFVEDIHKWREQRRFVVHAMKDLGLGRTVIEGEILNEIQHFLELLRNHKGKPMDLKVPLAPSTSNNICSLVFGKRYEYSDQDRVFLDKNLHTAIDSFRHTNFVSTFPWLLNVPFAKKFLSFDKSLVAVKNIRTQLKKEIKKHKDTFDAKNIRDFIDSYLVEMESRKKKDPNTTFTDDVLVCDVMDMFIAGSDTVHTVIMWCVYVAAAFTDVQDRVRKEILDLMGQDRYPELRDMKDAPVTHSFILEVMRWKTIVPISVPRYTLEDTTVGGFTIPKNTTVIANTWNAHHSPELWEEPESFKPDRFIAKDGKTVSRPSQFMPFSMGRRVCPGEPMAIMEIFLYLTSILQKFEVVFPKGYKPTYKANTRGTYALQAFKIQFIPMN